MKYLPLLALLLPLPVMAQPGPPPQQPPPSLTQQLIQGGALVDQAAAQIVQFKNAQTQKIATDEETIAILQAELVKLRAEKPATPTAPAPEAPK